MANLSAATALGATVGSSSNLFAVSLSEAAKDRLQHSGASSLMALIPISLKSLQVRKYYTTFHSSVNRWKLTVVLKVLQLRDNSTGRTTIRNPFSEPEAIKLLNIPPGRILMHPSLTVPVIFFFKVPRLPHDPFFILTGIIDGKFLRVFLRARFCLVPSVVFVKIAGASTAKHYIENYERATSCAPFKPPFGFPVIRP
jgi:hypothetical protein